MGAIDHLRTSTLGVVVQALQEGWVESIVRIGESHPLAACLIQALVTHGGETTIVGVVEHTNSLIGVLLQVLFNDLGGVVG